MFPLVIEKTEVFFMKRILSLFTALLPLAAIGSEIFTLKKTPPPFDADLFRRNEQVYSFHGDFLFWSVQEGALDYALSMTTPSGLTQSYALGDFKHATFYGEPGFRIAGVFFRAPKYWEFWTQYTRLTSRGENTASTPGVDHQYLTGTWPQIFTSPLATATSSIHLNYNVADLLITRVFFPNPHLRLRLVGGGSAAWMSQFWKILYTDNLGAETKIGNRWSFLGGGLRAGTIFDWYWFMDLYMTGSVSFAGLLGTYNNSAFQTETSLGTVRDAHFNDMRPAIMGQFSIGPSYQKNFKNRRFELFAGYEWNSWFNIQEIFRSTLNELFLAKETWINSGNVTLQGLTVRAVLDF